MCRSFSAEAACSMIESNRKGKKPYCSRQVEKSYPHFRGGDIIGCLGKFTIECLHLYPIVLDSFGECPQCC